MEDFEPTNSGVVDILRQVPLLPIDTRKHKLKDVGDPENAKRCRDYYERNREEKLIKMRAYYAKNKSKINAKRRRKNSETRQQANERNRRYYHNNQEARERKLANERARYAERKRLKQEQQA